MARKVSEKTNVAYFDESFVNSGLVDEPGFYIVEKEAYENMVKAHTPDGEEIPGLEVSLGPVLGKRVYPDERPFEYDEKGDVSNSREDGFFHTPFSSEGGDE